MLDRDSPLLSQIFGQTWECASEFKHLEWAILPIVYPAHDHVAFVGIVTMLKKVLTLVLELDPHVLPAARIIVRAS